MNTNTINELIARYCSMGVEYAYIGDILGVNRGKRLTKKDLSDSGQFFVYHGSKDTPLGKYHKFNAKGDTVIVVNTGGIGGVAYCKDAFWCSDGSFYLGHSSRMNNKFVYYYLSQYETYFFNHKRIGGVPTIDRSIVEMVKIPVPSLSVQEEIVKILDTYSELEAELESKLEAEIDARKKQYEYYLNQLLSFDENDKDVKFMHLCDVSKIFDGVHQTPKYKSQGIKFVSVENIDNLYATDKFISEEDYETYKIKPSINDVFMTRIGTIGKCGIVDKNEKLAYYVSLALIRPDTTKILPKYLKHIIESNWGKKELRKRTLINAVPIKINLSEIGKIIIPIPSIEKQERTVAILDEFNKLTNEISYSLQAEIDARKKQYEFYRNKLLTFKEAV